MNILIPHSWLLENLETQAKPEEIQKYLSLCGPSVERILQKEGEAVYDIEVTTNRVDSMSVRGIAREAAVILNQFQVKAKFLPISNLSNHSGSSSLPMIKIVNDPKLCKRVICVILEGVKHQPTPVLMAKRLRQIDQNIHDSVIDITNYVTHEFGHPCHAFDYDKLRAKGGEIRVVEAKKGETFTTLDGENFSTLGGEVVFKNAQGEIIDLPSIKGTLNTSVDSQTKNVLLLMESITPAKVRFASMTHAIRTTAAQLMEKGVDPHLASLVMQKVIKLYQDVCQIKALSNIYDDFPKPPKPISVTLETSVVWRYLGINLEQSLISQILTQLECLVTSDGQNKILVTPPSFRPDLETPIDLVEEIARIFGYHRLPSTLMSGRLPLNPPKKQNFDLENKIKILLVHLGVQELYTYSLVSEKLAKESGLDVAEHLKLQNPLSEDKVYLRRSLLPSLLEATRENPNYPQSQFFEIANTYQPKEGSLPQEELSLGLVFKTSYRHARGIIEALLDNLFINNCQFVFNEDKKVAEIIVKDAVHNNSDTLGSIQAIKQNLVVASLSLLKLATFSQTHPVYQPIAKTSPVIEDLTFTLAQKTRVGEIISVIKKSSDMVIAVELKNIYKRNFTFTISYLDTKTNLTNQVVKPIRETIVKQIEDQKLASLVGTLE